MKTAMNSRLFHVTARIYHKVKEGVSLESLLNMLHVCISEEEREFVKNIVKEMLLEDDCIADA